MPSARFLILTFEMHSHWPKAQIYLESRNEARRQTEATFVAKHPEVAPLLAIENEYVAGVMFSLSGKSFANVKHGLYISDLVVSFTRTHFIAQDLICHGELIEGAVLLRKQIELLARLHELARVDKLEHLLCKTPNVRELGESIRRLYSAYSEVAHSSNPVHLQQLGRIQVDTVEYTPVYPVYDSNALVTLRHQVLTVIEFHNWSHPYLGSIACDFEFNAAEELIGDLANLYIETAKFAGEEHI